MRPGLVLLSIHLKMFFFPINFCFGFILFLFIHLFSSFLKREGHILCISLAGVRCDLCPSAEWHLCRPHLQVQQPQRAASSLRNAVQDPAKRERESSGGYLN